MSTETATSFSRPKSEPRDQIVPVRFSKREVERIDDLAGRLRLSGRADVLREALDLLARRTAAWDAEARDAEAAQAANAI